MPIDEILIDDGPGETRVALLEQDRLIELVVARPDLESLVGNIYLGRVSKLHAGLEAAFVDLGLARDGFLALPEARPIGAEGGRDTLGDYLSEGDSVVVQVVRDAVPGKGPKVTTRLALPGHWLVFTPKDPQIRLSRRLGEGERDELASRVAGLTASDGGFVVRTAAAGADGDALRREATDLRAHHAEIAAKAAHLRAPACLHRDLEPVRRVLRDAAGPALRRIIFNDPAGLAVAREFCRNHAPELAGRLELARPSASLFEDRGIEDEIEAALAPGVALPGGGRLLFAETPALVAIDVDSGGHHDGGREETAFHVDREAASEIARQIRLRALSGLLVVDFVPLRRREHRDGVLARLREALADDPNRPEVAGFTRFGLVEITRRRDRPSLARTVLGPCAGCGGTGFARSPATRALEALRAVLREARVRHRRTWIVRAAPEVIGILEGALEGPRRETEERVGRPLRLVGDAALSGHHPEVVPADD